VEAATADLQTMLGGSIRARIRAGAQSQLEWRAINREPRWAGPLMLSAKPVATLALRLMIQWLVAIEPDLFRNIVELLACTYPAGSSTREHVRGLLRSTPLYPWRLLERRARGGM